MPKAAIIDAKFRCKVIHHLYVELGPQNANFGGFWVIFLWGRDLQTFGGALLITPRPDIV